MLIDLKELVYKYGLTIAGIIHVGAHTLEEKNIYNSLNISNILWFEANHEIANSMKAMYPNESIYSYAICDVDNQEREFIVTNNYQSSSILELKTHKIEHPSVIEMKRISVKTKTLDTFMLENNINTNEFNFLNMDIQGAELLALKGAGKLLSKLEYIYLEVNEKELYEGCGLLSDIDVFLQKFGFKRVEISMTPHGWGDAFYMKISDDIDKSKVSDITIDKGGIIPFLLGGLGNQIFIIVASYIVHKLKNCPLYLFENILENNHNKYNHNYNQTIFKYFGTHLQIEQPNTIEKLKKYLPHDYKQFWQSPSGFSSWNPNDVNPGSIMLSHYQYYPCIELYKQEITELLLQGLDEYKCDLSIYIPDFRIKDKNELAFLHIRRGDYLKNPHIHYIQPIEYYQNAVDTLLKSNKNVKNIIVLSDDINWVNSQQFFNSSLFKLVDCDDELVTLKIMTQCKGGAICANSTFSWWGAFLGAHNSNNPVIVPSKWIRDNPENLFPKEWIILDSCIHIKENKNIQNYYLKYGIINKVKRR